MASNKDIILVEGPTDATYLSKALEVFQKEGKFVELSFQYLPCGGVDGVIELVRHFKPKPGQHMYCFFDNDDKGWKGINKIFEKKGDDNFTPMNFGKAQKKGDFWIVPYPFENPKVGNSNVEDYFPRRVFLSHILKFKSLNTIIDKAGLKTALDADCKNNRLKSNAFKKFEKVFRLIQEIQAHDKNGKIKVDKKCNQS